MSQRKLPITVPPIIGYTIHAYPLSVIFNYNETLPWFLSNYIQLVCDTRYKGNFFNFSVLPCILEGSKWIDSVYPGNPWIKRNSIEGYFLRNYNIEINDFMINSINHNNYVVLHLDEYYIPDTRSYKIRTFYHENLVYGYNIKDKTYNALGFNGKGIFGDIRISFENFEEGVKSNFAYCPDGQIKLLSYNNEYSYEVDLVLISDQLTDFLYSQRTDNNYRTFRNPSQNCVYGLAVYGGLIEYFRLLSEGKVYHDIRPLHILWEHKKCMLLRMEYLLKLYPSTELEEIYNQYQLVEKKCLIMRQYLMKYSISNKPELLDSIINTLEMACVYEKDILSDFTLIIKALMK